VIGSSALLDPYGICPVRHCHHAKTHGDHGDETPWRGLFPGLAVVDRCTVSYPNHRGHSRLSIVPPKSHGIPQDNGTARFPRGDKHCQRAVLKI
jgi:hypothetical protein